MSVHTPTYDEQWAEYLVTCDEIALTPVCGYDSHRGRTTGCPWHDLDTRAAQLERDMDRLVRNRRTL